LKRRELKVKQISGLFAAMALAGIAFSASAQAQPPGSYQESCRAIRMQGSTLSAVCRTVGGRERSTALNIARCVGDIGNNNGTLLCSGGRPVPPRQGAGPGYPPPTGYGPPPRYGEDPGYRERCEHLWSEERELHDRLANTSYGEDRQRIEYRLDRLHSESQECRRR
jgi:hypothetical protein